MRFQSTEIPGVALVHIERHEDSRGFFARTWCRDEFAAAGLSPAVDQVSISYNTALGTLRGMHYQEPPHEEVKLVRVTRGAVYDVALDLRKGSPTYRRWVAAELTEDNRTAFYLPQGVAHGFQTLTDGAEVLYQISPAFVPGAGRGVRYDDPAFGIEWPHVANRIMSERDRAFPDYVS